MVWLLLLKMLLLKLQLQQQIGLLLRNPERRAEAKRR